MTKDKLQAIVREDAKPDTVKVKTLQASAGSKENEPHTPEKRKKKKKKAPKNGTEPSKDGDVKAPKKHKSKKNNSKPRRGSNPDVEVHSDVQTKTLQRNVQVKQRSFTTFLDTGSSTIAVGDTSTGAAATTPVEDDMAGFASGSYGMLLETKRAEKLCLSLALTKRHVGRMLRAFRREDQSGTGEITTGEFFSMMHEEPRHLTKGLFEEVGLSRNLRMMHFDDFVLCIATVASWSKSELLHYAFKQFDVDESGVMDARELRSFCEGLKNDSSFYYAGNVDKAREKMVIRDWNLHHHFSQDTSRANFNIEANTIIDLEDLAKGSNDFQLAFYPLLQLQQNVRACALGERFWARVTQRRQDVEVIVHYMRLHSGKLPSFSTLDRITAYLMPFSRANAKLVVRKLAVLKFAEEERIWQEQALARAEVENTFLMEVQEKPSRG